VKPDLVAAGRPSGSYEGFRGQDSTSFQVAALQDRCADIGQQLMRSGTSVAANYRAACRSRSKAEWVAKIGIVVEEADETVFWLEMLSDCGIVPLKKLESLLAEAHELSAIFTASHFTARRNR